ncbi:MAG: aspartate-semialdehyde dehydrogenase [Spirochaetales bacterium]
MATPRLKVGILGATGMVGQRFLTLLEHHPWFTVTVLAASASSAGKTYAQAVNGRWALSAPLPTKYASMTVLDASQVSEIAAQVDFVFCAVDMKKDEILALEDAYAKAEVPVVSNNSAHRWTPDVPMIIPELNPEHAQVITDQRKRLGTKVGFVTAKPNCSIQSYVPLLHALREFGVKEVSVCTYQAISGAGKTFASWPEMVDNVIPHIGGEDEKSETEPLKIWGTVKNGRIEPASSPKIGAQCIRVAASDGHLAAVSVNFERKPTREQILERWSKLSGAPQASRLPSAPVPFVHVKEEDNRPQTRLDRDLGNGMAISVGRLRPDNLFDWKFVGLSHNTVRGAAGGAVLTAEFLASEGWIPAKMRRSRI